MGTATRILLIDDDEVDRAAVRRALMRSELEFELTEAVDGATGLRLARERRFDCVLLDYRLPDIDAFDVLKALLSGPNDNRAVLMLTGEADQDVAFRLMRAGALDYLSKAEATPSSLARAIRYARARREFLSELEAARREAEEKSRALDMLNRQKSLLFSIVAHDLRNPFQVILGLSENLSRTVAERDIALIERRSQGIHEAATQAHALMEGLLAWASLQMDSIAVVKSEVDLEEVARQTLEKVARAAADKSLSLRSHCSGIRLDANADMLSAVLRNLVGNAVKFTRPGGTITITAHSRGDGVEIAVADTGVGIAPDKVNDLFRLDRRVTTNGTAGERGSGLGLLLCHDLVERLGGELKVRSTPGEGTTFHFALPHPVHPAGIEAENANGDASAGRS